MNSLRLITAFNSGCELQIYELKDAEYFVYTDFTLQALTGFVLT